MTSRKHQKRLARARAAKTGESYVTALRHLRQRERNSNVSQTEEGQAPTLVRCSFCGKSEQQVSRIVAGPGVFICDACIDLAQQTLSAADAAEAASARGLPVTEAQEPPVRRWADLPEPLAGPARTGYSSWQARQLDAAGVALTELLERARAAGSLDGIFHGLHLLACVAYDQGDLSRSRALHDEVLQMADEMDFHGGRGSSQFDIAMIDEAEGDFAAARARYSEARESFERGGYVERIPVVEAAIARLPAET